jgi:hypothetical protein
MTYAYYEDDLVTEYSDGTEEVRFTNEELEAMAADPVRFGLVRRCGHAFSFAYGSPVDSDCMICEAGAEYDYDDDGGFAPAGQS